MTNDQQRFDEHLKWAASVVQTWPLWKQRILGELRHKPRGNATNSVESDSDTVLDVPIQEIRPF